MKRLVSFVVAVMMMVCFVGGNLSAQVHDDDPTPINPVMQVLEEDAENSSMETEMRGVLQLPINGNLFFRMVFLNLFNVQKPNMWAGYKEKFSELFSCGFALGVIPDENKFMASLFPSLDLGNLKFWSEASIIQGGDFYSFVEAKYSPKEWMIYPGIDFETKLGKFFLVGPSATFVLGKYIKTKIGIYFKSFSPDDDGVKMNPVFIEKPHHHRPLLKKDIPMPWKKTMALRAYIIIAL